MNGLTNLVDQMTSGGGFAGIDVTDNDQVNMDLFLSAATLECESSTDEQREHTPL